MSFDLQQFYKELRASDPVDWLESIRQKASPRDNAQFPPGHYPYEKLGQRAEIDGINLAEWCALLSLEHSGMNTPLVKWYQSFLREAKESGIFELHCLELATGLR